MPPTPPLYSGPPPGWTCSSGMAQPSSPTLANWGGLLNGLNARGHSVSVTPTNKTSAWFPSPREVELWVSPAGWAEAAYLKNEPVDVSDTLTFLDKINVTEIEIATSYRGRKVSLDGTEREVPMQTETRVTLNNVVVIGAIQTQLEAAFPEGELRDLVLIATGKDGKKAMAVVSNLMLTEREMIIRADDSALFETVVLTGEKLYGFREPL
jgi:hypothetical protein